MGSPSAISARATLCASGTASVSSRPHGKRLPVARPSGLTTTATLSSGWMRMVRGWRAAVMRRVVAPRSSSSHQAGSFGIELPVGDKVLHGKGIVARAERLVDIEIVGALDGIEVQLNAEAGALGQSNVAVSDLERIACEMLPVLPDPVGIDGGDVAGRGGGGVRHHGERDVEMVVGVRAPGESVVATGLRYAHRALHRPEMRVGERNVD